MYLPPAGKLAENVSQDQQTYLVSTEHPFIVLPCYFFSKTPISVSDTPVNPFTRARPRSLLDFFLIFHVRSVTRSHRFYLLSIFPISLSLQLVPHATNQPQSLFSALLPEWLSRLQIWLFRGPILALSFSTVYPEASWDNLKCLYYQVFKYMKSQVQDSKVGGSMGVKRPVPF